MTSHLIHATSHTYTNPAFSDIITDACNFFSDTPVHPLPLTERFVGTGVYALYYVGSFEIYTPLSALNSRVFKQPIYVGKAVPKGWRQSRTDATTNASNELCNRLREHARSIATVTRITVNEFHCRFMILDGEASDMIGTVEAALIKKFMPLWNTAVDGFGNHDPGSGRYEQARSDWDVLHVGRSWAEKCSGTHTPLDVIISNVKNHLAKI